MIKAKITITIIIISVVDMIVNSGDITISNIPATVDEGDNTHSYSENTPSSDKSSTQTSGNQLPSS